MKSNSFKYIFIIIIIGLLGYAGYMLYGKKDANKNEVETTYTEEEQQQILTDIRIPIVNFDTINPILSKNQNIQNISRLIYEPLLNITQDYKIELCLAKEWTKSSETSYIIKLKDNIKWNDGNTFTAKDVQYTIDRLKDSNVTSIYSYNVQDVIGVEVIDNNTIKINLNREVPFFEYNLTFPIMSSKYYENEDFVNTSKNNNPAGTGRFKVINENGKIALKQNENWWNKENDKNILQEINIIKYSNMGEVYNAFKIGNLDILTTDSLEVENYIGTIGYNIKEYVGRQLDFIAFNCKDEVLLNKEVRQAISYAIDKENIVSGIYGGKYNISNFVLDYGNYLYNIEEVKHEYNQEIAKTILVENGWNYKYKTWQKVGNNYRTMKLRFDLVVNSSNGKRVQVAENIKNTLEGIGIKINIIKANDQMYRRYLENKNYDMILTGVYIPYSPDLSKYFGENNLANYDNPEVNSIMQEIKNIRDEKVLKEKYNQLIKIYKDEIPYVFLYNNKSKFVYSTNLRGTITPNNYNIFYNIGSWYRGE